MKATSSGLSLCSLLTVLFVGLKLCDQISWSWWWVLSPLWMPWAIVAIVGAAMMVVLVAAKVIAKAGGTK